MKWRINRRNIILNDIEKALNELNAKDYYPNRICIPNSLYDEFLREAKRL